MVGCGMIGYDKAGCDRTEEELKVTYLNHSGFLLKWETCCWVFDYYKGEIPKLDPTKEIFVFVSHSHRDHFNPAVFALAAVYPKVTYIFSNEVKQGCRKLVKASGKVQLSQKQMFKVCGGGIASKTIHMVPIPEVQFLRSRTHMELHDQQGNPLNIFGLQSTDCGCAFLIGYQGKIIYHAGDLHWWYWSGETESFNKKMTADFKKEMKYLAGQEIDLAFSPLDPRQGSDYALGMNYLLQQAKVKHVFPMHCWNDYSVCGRYQKEYQLPQHTTFYPIEKDGQSWELDSWS